MRKTVDTVPHRLPITHNNDNVSDRMISSIVKSFSARLSVFIRLSLSQNKAVFIVNKLHACNHYTLKFEKVYPDLFATIHQVFLRSLVSFLG